MGISIAVPGDRASADSVRISCAARCNNQPVVRGIRIAGVVPMANEPADLADQLAKEGYGEAGELRELLPVVYLDLKRIAHSQLFRRTPGASLSTTALVHETWIKLARGNSASIHGRAHFMALCARVMRQILIDRSRARAAEKRGSEMLHQKDGVAETEPAQAEAQLRFVNGLDALAAVDPRLARIIEQHWLIGLGVEELADLHGVGVRMIQLELKRARAWVGELLAP